MSLIITVVCVLKSKVYHKDERMREFFVAYVLILFKVQCRKSTISRYVINYISGKCAERKVSRLSGEPTAAPIIYLMLSVLTLFFNKQYDLIKHGGIRPSELY